MNIRTLSISLLTALSIYTAFDTNAAETGAPVLGTWGLELQNLSPTLKPGDDFYRYVNEGWLKNARPVQGLPYSNAFTDAYVRTQGQLNTLVKEILQQSPSPTSDEAQVAALYRSYRDYDRRNALGLTPIKPDLDAIYHASSKEDLVRTMARPLSPNGVMGFGVITDSKQPERYVVGIVQNGLSLPGPDYYLAEGEPYASMRQAYLTYLINVFQRAGIDRADQRAAALIDFETKIAQTYWTPAEQRDVVKSYHLMPREALSSYAPGMPWQVFFEATGLDMQGDVLLLTDTATQKLARLFAETDLAVLQDHFAFHLINRAAPFLSEDWENLQFEFFSKKLAGIPAPQLLENRAVDFLHKQFGEIFGRVYAKAYFPDSSRQQMNDMVANLREAFRERLQTNAWMDAPTRAQALIKLDAIVSQIGFPDQWRDWSAVQFSSDDLIGNLRKLSQFENQDALKKLKEKRRDWQWPYPTMEINAGYSSTDNTITFPAGILQSPFFDPHADAAVNYGSIGAGIGHELSHGFDDQGSRSDEKGALRDWWTADSRAEFERRTSVLAAQYDAFSLIEGMHVNGRLTLGENIADLGGLTVAYDAYRKHVAKVDGGKAKVIDGFTGDQRFFMAWSQLWRDYTTPDMARQNILNDPHSPGAFRANGPVRNVDVWYDTFGVAPDSPMFIPKDKRVRIW